MKGEGVDYKSIAEGVARILEGFGILAIVAGIAWSGMTYFTTNREDQGTTAYQQFRRRIGRSILLGLEILVAADIIHTVATTPTFQSLGVLGLLILIRTFLSIEIEMELEGRWPWQREAPAGVGTSGDG